MSDVLDVIKLVRIMRKLLKKLKTWYGKQPWEADLELTKWQRGIIYNFVIDYIKGVKEHNG